MLFFSVRYGFGARVHVFKYGHFFSNSKKMQLPTKDQFSSVLKGKHLAFKLIEKFEKKLKKILPLTPSNQEKFLEISEELENRNDQYRKFCEKHQKYRDQIEQVMSVARLRGAFFPERLQFPRDLDIVKMFFEGASEARRNGFNPTDGLQRPRQNDIASRYG